MQDLAQHLDVALDAAYGAGETILDHYGTDIDVALKGGDPRDLVTAADLAAEAAILAALQRAQPGYAFLSEEGVQPGDAVDDETPTWVVDPIDGTSNFAHGLPLFAVSIALHHAGQSQVGVVHAPALGWTFAAARGLGATLNQRPLHVSDRPTLHGALVGCDWSRHLPLRRRAIAAFGDFAPRVHTLRSMGSAALGFAAVAAGWLDLYFNYSLQPWDTAAGALLVQEAGGRVTSLAGDPWRVATPDVLVSNGALHEAGQAVLARHLPYG